MSFDWKSVFWFKIDCIWLQCVNSSSPCRGAEWRRWWSATPFEGSSWANCESARYFSACPAEGFIWFYVFPLRRLVSALTLLSKKLNCYKVTLECSDKNVAFYQKFGYNPSNETYMQCRFFDWGRRRPSTAYFSRGDDGPHTPSPPQLVLKTCGKLPRSLSLFLLLKRHLKCQPR